MKTGGWRCVLAPILVVAACGLTPALSSAAFGLAPGSARETALRRDRWLSALRSQTTASNGDDGLANVLVTFRGGASAAELAAANRIAGSLRVRRTYRHLPIVAATLALDQVAALASDSDVVQVAPDLSVRLAPLAKQSPEIPSTFFAPVTVREADPGISEAQAKLGLDGDAAHDGLHVYGKKDEVIALVDTGVDATQPDLAGGKILAFQDFVTHPSPTCPPPPNPIVPWDAVGHGTLVASVAAGAGLTDATKTGVAPGAALVVLKVFDCTASAPQSIVASALDWLLSNRVRYGVDVVNMSFGAAASGLDGTDLLSQFANQLAAAGVVPVVAAGNNGPTRATIQTPGVARWALTAGAEKANAAGHDTAEFSSRGPTADGRIKPDVLTPGVDILGVAAHSAPPKYRFDSGTSFSAPYLAGLAALALQASPALKPSGTACDPATCPDGVVDATMKSPVMHLTHATAADWNVPGPDVETGWGVLHAWPFLAAAAKSSAPGPSYPNHLVRQGSVSDHGESFIPISVRAGQTVTVGMTVPTIDGFRGPFQGLFVLDDHGSRVSTSIDCASGEGNGFIFGTCYPYGVASRAVGLAWTPATSGTAFIGVRSLAGATTDVIDIDGARAAADPGIPVRVAVTGTPLTPGGPAGSVSVTLGRRPANAVHVHLFDDGGISLSTAVLTFGPKNWNRSQAVSVTAVAGTARRGNPHGSALVAVATGATIDDSGVSRPRSVPVLDDPTLPDALHVERVSLSDSGAESWGPAYDAPSPYPYGSEVPYVSSDGSVVAFTSRATDLTRSDPNDLRADVFVRDRATGRTEKITPDTSTSDAYLQGLSTDGRFVLFSEYGAITPGDTNNAVDLFVKDRTTGSLTRVNVTATGSEMPRACGGCLGGPPGSISGDGRHVAFITDVPMTPDAPPTGAEVYVKDLSTGAVTRVSVASNGANGRPDEGHTWAMTTALNEDGSVVLFSTASDGLAPGALAGQLNDYEHIMASGQTNLVNSDANGTALPLKVGTPLELSSDGRYAAFESAAAPYYRSKVFVKNLATGAIDQANLSGSGDPSIFEDELTSISADGRAVAFWSGDPTIGGPGMVMRNLDTGIVTVIDGQFTGNMFEIRTFARISAGADFAVWDTSDPTLVTGDTNMARDIFWRQLR